MTKPTERSMQAAILAKAIMAGIADDLVPGAAARVETAIRITLDGGLTAPLAGEMNPDNPALTQMRNQWHQLCAFVMLHLGSDHVTLTLADIEDITENKLNGRVIGLFAHRDSLEIKLLTTEEARRLATDVRARGGAAARV